MRVNQIAGLEQFIEPLEGKEARLGHEHEMRCGCQRIEREHAQAWRAVDQDCVVCLHPVELVAKDGLVCGRPTRLARRERSLRWRCVDPHAVRTMVSPSGKRSGSSSTSAIA